MACSRSAARLCASVPSCEPNAFATTSTHSTTLRDLNYTVQKPRGSGAQKLVEKEKWGRSLNNAARLFAACARAPLILLIKSLKSTIFHIFFAMYNEFYLK